MLVVLPTHIMQPTTTVANPILNYVFQNLPRNNLTGATSKYNHWKVNSAANLLFGYGSVHPEDDPKQVRHSALLRYDGVC